MKNYQFIQIEVNSSFATVYLNRPEVKNAFQIEMIRELIAAFQDLPKNEKLKAIVLKGKGNTFCAGADINWMKSAIQFTYDENLKESEWLANCFKSIYLCPIPTIAVVHGAVMGGANGLMAACDFVIASEETQFSFSEVKLGIIPATIAPFIIKRIGEFAAKDLMMTGRRFEANEALEKKLVSKVVKATELADEENKLLNQFKETGPLAVRATKQLIFNVVNEWKFEDYSSKSAENIAQVRTTKEAQEGMQAFIEKRKPNWVEH